MPLPMAITDLVIAIALRAPAKLIALAHNNIGFFFITFLGLMNVGSIVLDEPTILVITRNIRLYVD